MEGLRWACLGALLESLLQLGETLVVRGHLLARARLRGQLALEVQLRHSVALRLLVAQLLRLAQLRHSQLLLQLARV